MIKVNAGRSTWLVGLTLLCGTVPMQGAAKATPKPKIDCENLIKDVGECGGAFVRVVIYDQEAVFGQDDQGSYRCFELQERLEKLNREFEKRRADLRERGRSLKNMYQDQEMGGGNVEQMGAMMKEQSALDIDAKMASQEFQTRFGQIQAEFMKEVRAAIEELADENEWEIVLPIDKKVAFAGAKVDVTEKILKRLNDKYRTKQRTKKFAEPAKADGKKGA